MESHNGDGPSGRPGSGFSPLTGALATSSELLSGAVLLGFTGALAALGQDGLALIAGLSGGLLLAGALVVPHLQRCGLRGPLDLVSERFGLFARLAASLVLIAVSGVLLTAELSALGTALSVASGLGRPEALALAALAVLLAGLAASARGTTQLQAILFPLIAAALALPVMLPALGAGGVPLPQLTFGTTLQAISDLELKLLEKELADPVSLKAYLTPFNAITPVGALLLSLSVALGLASLPRVLSRPAMAETGYRARLTIALSAVLVLLAALALAPAAASIRLGILSGLVGREPAALDPWLLELGGLGLVKVCGVHAVSADAVSAACAALADPPMVLRLHEIEMDQAVALFALPGLSGLPMAVTLSMAVVVALAALAAATWLVVTLRHELTGRGTLPEDASLDAGPSRGVVAMLARALAVFLVPLAAFWASTEPAELTELLAWGLSLAAAGLAPVVLAAIWWSRATPAGAFLAIVTGVSLTAYYIIATRYFAPQFYETWSALSNAGFGAIADYEAARDAFAAAADEERVAALATLHAEARRVANWWGIKPAMAGAMGAAFGLLVLVLASAVTPRSTLAQRELLARMRGGHAEHYHHIRRWHWRRK